MPDILYERRINRGMTLDQAAERIGVSQRTLRDAEQDRAVPRPKNMKLIADFYDLRVTDIWPLADVMK
jgi:transcriptional regulator with XRE-family HTH domain